MARQPEDNTNWGGKRNGAGRKPPPVPKKTVSICLSANILEIAQSLAKARNISFSAFVEQALREQFFASLNQHQS